MKNRICIITLPRSGSQYVEELIIRTIEKYTKKEVWNFREPFTKSDAYVPYFVNGKFQTIWKDLSYGGLFREHIDNVISIIESAPKDQSMVMRIMLVNESPAEILQVLRLANFSFIFLKRENVKNHLLSWATSLTTDEWKDEDSWFTKFKKLFKKQEKKEMVKFNEFGKLIWLHNKITNFDDQIKKLPIRGDVVFYENVLDTLAGVLGVPEICKRTTLRKQGYKKLDLLATNAIHVRVFIDDLLQK